MTITNYVIWMCRNVATTHFVSVVCKASRHVSHCVGAKITSWMPLKKKTKINPMLLTLAGSFDAKLDPLLLDLY